MDINPRRCDTWGPIVSKIRRRLGGRHNRHLSFGDPFLWGRDKKKKKVNWIKWENVCCSKKDGGLGVKYYGKFNLALLGKWKWRILNEENSLRTNLLSCRYGDIKRVILSHPSFCSRSKISLWWRDICSIGVSDSDHASNWFSSTISLKLGSGHFLEFWNDCWIGATPFSSLFPDLYHLMANRFVKVADMRVWFGDFWHWSFCLDGANLEQVMASATTVLGR
ncbi:unnamed protein product [Lathyrus sativus]|nr:unnamed protein product [Lathyrus sativus]